MGDSLCLLSVEDTTVRKRKSSCKLFFCNHYTGLKRQITQMLMFFGNTGRDAKRPVSNRK